MSVFPFTDRDFDALDINDDGILSADEIFEGLQHKYDQVCSSTAHERCFLAFGLPPVPVEMRPKGMVVSSCNRWSLYSSYFLWSV